MSDTSRQSDRDFELLRQYLSGRDVKCPGCGYNLRELTTQRCPECGVVIALGINPSRKRPLAWTFALVGTAFALYMPLWLIGFFLDALLSADLARLKNVHTLLGLGIGGYSFVFLAILIFKPNLIYRIPRFPRTLVVLIPWFLAVIYLGI